MMPEKIENHIDKKIDVFLASGKTYNEVISDIELTLGRFVLKQSFIKVDKKYLLKNWKVIDFRKRYTTYYVIFSKKRINDIKWIMENSNKFSDLSENKLFGLVKLKDKLRPIKND